MRVKEIKEKVTFVPFKERKRCRLNKFSVKCLGDSCQMFEVGTEEHHFGRLEESGRS